jgi:hypothetical protein
MKNVLKVCKGKKQVPPKEQKPSEGREQDYLFILVNFHAPGSGSGSALTIRSGSRTEKSKRNHADPDPNTAKRSHN